MLPTVNTLLLVIAGLLLIQTLFLFAGPWYRRRARRAAAHPVDLFPTIPPAERATPPEQQALLASLERFPQIRRLPDGSVVDWLAGTRLVPCTCRHARAQPHLTLHRLDTTGLAMISGAGLAHYLAYHERLATVLSGQPTSRTPDAGEGGAA